ncbi:hypothetical protein Tco_1091673 [Tanacetum coccineum]|uniref:Uncharacterized protein n=1 Tax=Tanacetum coccineum TaxID=301880 RepID=A0ABQ5I7P6_9ASTR
MESIENCIVERTLHAHEIQKRLRWLNDRKLQIQVCKVQEVKALDASSGDIDISKIVSDKGNAKCSQNDCSKTGNDQSSDKQRAMNVVGQGMDEVKEAIMGMIRISDLPDTDLIASSDKVGAHKPIRVVLHPFLNAFQNFSVSNLCLTIGLRMKSCLDGLVSTKDFIRKSAEVANREIMIGVETRMKEYKTCWVDKLSIVNHNNIYLTIGLRMKSCPDGLVSTKELDVVLMRLTMMGTVFIHSQNLRPVLKHWKGIIGIRIRNGVSSMSESSRLVLKHWKGIIGVRIRWDLTGVDTDGFLVSLLKDGSESSAEINQLLEDAPSSTASTKSSLQQDTDLIASLDKDSSHVKQRCNSEKSMIGDEDTDEASELKNHMGMKKPFFPIGGVVGSEEFQIPQEDV